MSIKRKSRAKGASAGLLYLIISIVLGAVLIPAFPGSNSSTWDWIIYVPFAVIFGLLAIGMFFNGIIALLESLFSNDAEKVEFWEKESKTGSGSDFDMYG